MLADLLTRLATNLPAFPTADVISITIVTIGSPKVQVHVVGAAGPALADALCDRAAEEVNVTTANGVIVSEYHQSPLISLPGHVLVWFTPTSALASPAATDPGLASTPG